MFGAVEFGVPAPSEAGHEVTNRRLVAVGPQDGDVGDELGVLLDRRVGHLKCLIRWPEGDSNAFVLERLREYRAAGQHGEERSQPLLTIHDQQLCHLVAVAPAHLTGADLCAGLPEHERPDRVPAVHRVEEVADLRGGPDKRSLDVGKGDVPVLDVFDQVSQRVTSVTVQSWHESSLRGPTFAGIDRRSSRRVGGRVLSVSAATVF